MGGAERQSCHLYAPEETRFQNTDGRGEGEGHAFTYLHPRGVLSVPSLFPKRPAHNSIRETSPFSETKEGREGCVSLICISYKGILPPISTLQTSHQCPGVRISKTRPMKQTKREGKDIFFTHPRIQHKHPTSDQHPWLMGGTRFAVRPHIQGHRAGVTTPIMDDQYADCPGFEPKNKESQLGVNHYTTEALHSRETSHFRAASSSHHSTKKLISRDKRRAEGCRFIFLYILHAQPILSQVSVIRPTFVNHSRSRTEGQKAVFRSSTYPTSISYHYPILYPIS